MAMHLLLPALLFLGTVRADDGPNDYDVVVKAHAITGSIAVAFIFPVAAILLRSTNSRFMVWIHAAINVFGLVLLTGNVGMGIWMARTSEQLEEAHPIVGLIVFALAMLQPVGGLLHHHLFLKTERRTVVSHGHIRLGAIIITLGIINGGLGLLLAGDATTGERVAYGVIGGFFWLAYMVSTTQSEHRRDAITHRMGKEEDLSSIGE